MKNYLLLFFLLTISANAFSGCLEDLVKRGVGNCGANGQVGSILNCVNSMEASIQYCKQQLEQRKQKLEERKEKISANEVTKIKQTTEHSAVLAVTAKQNARYSALKKLSDDFTEYSDKLKSAISRTNSSYKELKSIDLKNISEEEKAGRIASLEKISKRIGNESKNAQSYFNEFKPRFLSTEAILNINISDSAYMPVKNLKSQNDKVISIIKDTIDSLKTVSENDSELQINFPITLEALIRDGINQKAIAVTCEKNESKDCLKNIQVNNTYQKEIATRLAGAKSLVTNMKNSELQAAINNADKRNDLIEFARLYDLGIASGDIK